MKGRRKKGRRNMHKYVIIINERRREKLINELAVITFFACFRGDVSIIFLASSRALSREAPELLGALLIYVWRDLSSGNDFPNLKCTVGVLPNTRTLYLILNVPYRSTTELTIIFIRSKFSVLRVAVALITSARSSSGILG
jgi:hypothetical protein